MSRHKSELRGGSQDRKQAMEKEVSVDESWRLPACQGVWVG